MARGVSSLEEARRAAQKMRALVPGDADELALLPSDDHILLVALAALVGLVAGLAATLLRVAVRIGHLIFIRTDTLWEVISDPGSPLRERLVNQLEVASPDVQVLILGVLSLAGFSIFGVLRDRRPHEAGPRRHSRAFLVGFLLGGAALIHYALGLLTTTVDVLTPGQDLAIMDAPWWALIGVAVVGGVLVGLANHYSPPIETRGVPYVMAGAALSDGRLDVREGPAYAGAAALTVSGAGSAGLEGPVVVFGATSASGLGQALGLSRDRLRVLVAAGAAAGIAASFNAPIAGALFALEIVVGDFALSTFSPVVMASVVGTVVHRSIEGDHPIFREVHFELLSGYELSLYVLLGLACGIVGTAFVRLLEATRKAADERLSVIPSWLRPTVGLLIVVAIAIAFERRDILGTGYGVIDSLLDERAIAFTAVLILATKLVATAMTLGTGGVGGVFFPSLVLGAATGSAFGSVAQQLFGDRVAGPGSYALVGMGAVLTAVQHAPLTACVMIFELCNDYSVMVPLLISCILATLLTMRTLKGSIYERRLRSSGIVLSRGKESGVLRSLTVADAMNTDFVTIHRATHLVDIERIVANCITTTFPLVDDGARLVGVLSIHDIRPLLLEASMIDELIIATDIGTRDVVTIEPEASLLDALERLAMQPFENLIVTDPANRDRVVGLLSHHAVMAAYKAALQREGLFERP